MVLVQIQGVVEPILYVTTSFILFKLLSLAVEKWVPVPAFAKKIGRSIKFHNILISLIHSAICSVWVGLCFYLHPDLASDIINNHYHVSYLLVCMSIGYFIHDLIHALQNKSFSEGWEIMIHHCTVLTCFTLAAIQCRYTSYVVVSLLTEVNSVFLHFRQLMNLGNITHETTVFRVNSMVNVATFALFRLGTIVWMTRWIVLQRENLPPILHAIGFLGLVIMTLINVILFGRILLKDFWGKINRKPKNHSQKLID